ncbi:DNRLRE domain-containing protein [Formosa sp. PL04]|uniref:CBM96 family carbohydrate-binding protein n=1 Tax=Formosa sp. PL04 TaxID=3081755 RepID=UPI00298234D3|nr:DNRLRE domain-containing protein [Formosa sp. PL04]MDW5288285.1 DNRLRE domain-containing protein [Formosa sp. PL04]
MIKKITRLDLTNPTLFKKKLSCICLLFLGAFSVQAQFVHPGITHKKSDLDRVKAMVEAQVDPWYTSYQEMANDSKSSYDYVVQGDESFTELGRDSNVNYGAWNSDIRAAYYNALRWYIEGESKHADKAVEIFKAWSNLTSVTSGGTEALSGGIAYIMIEAAEIVKSTYPGWNESDIQSFKDMLVYPGYSTTTIPDDIRNNTTFYWSAYEGDPVRHGNQGLSGWRAIMAMGIFLDNEVMYDRALNYVKGEPHRADDLAYPSGPNTSNEITASNDYSDTYSITRGNTIEDYGYNEVMTNYIYENGQCQESARDQQHTMFGIGLLTSMAEMAWNQGDDLYSFTNDRLLLGLEYNMKYNVSEIQSYDDQTTPWVPSVESGEFKEGFDRTGRWYSKAISPEGIAGFPGVRPVFEMPIAHYYGRGFKTEDDVKWITRARDKAIEVSSYEAQGWTNDAIGWGALTARRPMLCYGDPIIGFDDLSLPMYAMHDISNPIEVENFDYDPIQQGEGRIYHDATTSNTGGGYRTFDAVDLEDLGDGNYALTNIEAGEWLTYTISVPETAKYSISISYMASQADGTIQFSFAGEDKTGAVVVPNNTADGEWKTLTIAEDIELTKGVQSLKITFGGSSEAFKLDQFSFAQTGIVKDDQEIQFFTLPYKVLGSEDFDPMATSSSALSVSYTSSNESVATIVDGQVHLVGTGMSTISAIQEGDDSFNPAPEVTQELNVVSQIGGTMNVIVDADAYVHEGKANDNFGEVTSMVTKQDARYVYLKFDLSTIPGPIVSAKLRMYQRTKYEDIRVVYDVADDTWVESEITWNNKPNYENERSSITTIPSTWNEWDASSYVAQEYNDDKIITMAIKDPANSGIGIDWYSKEFEDNLPAELIVEYYDSTLSIDDKEIPIAVYPNPVKNELNISLLSANLNLEDTEVILNTINGQQVLKLKLNSAHSKLDLSKLNSGIYILTIKDSSKIINKKIIKL